MTKTKMRRLPLPGVAAAGAGGGAAVAAALSPVKLLRDALSPPLPRWSTAEAEARLRQQGGVEVCASTGGAQLLVQYEARRRRRRSHRPHTRRHARGATTRLAHPPRPPQLRTPDNDPFTALQTGEPFGQSVQASATPRLRPCRDVGAPTVSLPRARASAAGALVTRVRPERGRCERLAARPPAGRGVGAGRAAPFP